MAGIRVGEKGSFVALEYFTKTTRGPGSAIFHILRRSSVANFGKCVKVSASTPTFFSPSADNGDGDGVAIVVEVCQLTFG
jgi:hypothetical protein